MTIHLQSVNLLRPAGHEGTSIPAGRSRRVGVSPRNSVSSSAYSYDPAGDSFEDSEIPQSMRNGSSVLNDVIVPLVTAGLFFWSLYLCFFAAF